MLLSVLVSWFDGLVKEDSLSGVLVWPGGLLVGVVVCTSDALWLGGGFGLLR